MIHFYSGDKIKNLSQKVFIKLLIPSIFLHFPPLPCHTSPWIFSLNSNLPYWKKNFPTPSLFPPTSCLFFFPSDRVYFCFLDLIYNSLSASLLFPQFHDRVHSKIYSRAESRDLHRDHVLVTLHTLLATR